MSDKIEAIKTILLSHKVPWDDVAVALEIRELFERDCQERVKRIFEEISNLGLFQGTIPPVEGDLYLYLGDYILKYGKNSEPQIGLLPLYDVEE